jgi:hypothetical protein
MFELSEIDEKSFVNVKKFIPGFCLH